MAERSQSRLDARSKLRERLLYFVLVPLISAAVLLLGAAALRTSLQIEKARQQTVFDATWSLAEERRDRLDKMIIAQDNVVGETVDVAAIATISERWLTTAIRETPTVQAVVVLDLSVETQDIVAFVSRASRPQNLTFKEALRSELVAKMEVEEDPKEQLRHLHHVVGKMNYLVSYWQRNYHDREFLVVAWHDVDSLVESVMPQLYRDVDRNSRMNVIDEEGKILFGSPLAAGGFTVGLNFPTTLYNWRLQVALTSSEGLAQRAVRQRMVQLGVVGLAVLIAIAGMFIVVRASIQERRLAGLKGDFVANVSHELKTPLASVRMFGELLLTERVASKAKEKEYLQIIVGESERLTNLIDNVLDFAKVEKGKEAYEFKVCSVADSVRRAVDVQRYHAERLGIELRVDLSEVETVADERALELATMNLIDNALKYARDTEFVEVALFEERGRVHIRVTDSGPGVAPEERQRIFDRFERGSQEGSRPVRGSGIGLALVTHITMAHRGTVELESPVADGRGARFEMRFPVRRRPV